jgi:hypothetical protein
MLYTHAAGILTDSARRRQCCNSSRTPALRTDCGTRTMLATSELSTPCTQSQAATETVIGRSHCVAKVHHLRKAAGLSQKAGKSRKYEKKDLTADKITGPK